MTGEHIRNLINSPFQPFRIHMADGRSVDVPHPDFANLSPSARMLIVFRPDDSFEMIDVLLVTSFETFEPNGALKPRRRKRS
jgi:hypothetical protein